jgi:hypothetical protein
VAGRVQVTSVEPFGGRSWREEALELGTTEARTSRGAPRPPAPSWRGPAARELIARARQELAAATDATDPAERFRRAHLAALRIGASVLAERRVTVRGRPRPVWELVEREAPELERWAAYFAAGAALRAAIESGREPVVAPDVAEAELAMATRFLDLVEAEPEAWAS